MSMLGTNNLEVFDVILDWAEQIYSEPHCSELVSKRTASKQGPKNGRSSRRGLKRNTGPMQMDEGVFPPRGRGGKASLP